jgi:hypothetical protein
MPKMLVKPIASGYVGMTVGCEVDSVADSVSIDLAKSPFNLKFDGNLPVAIENFSDNISGGGTRTVTLDGTRVTVSWSTPPTSGTQFSFDLAFPSN